MVWIAFALRVSRTEQIRISLRIVVERNLKFPIKAERVTERNVRARIFRGDNPACASNESGIVILVGGRENLSPFICGVQWIRSLTFRPECRHGLLLLDRRSIGIGCGWPSEA
jgi:hypothetical protein